MIRILLLFLFIISGFSVNAQKQIVWIDADTGNEIDDVYALARLFLDTRISIAGVSSAHFNNADLLVFEKWNQYDTKGINTVEISQKLNEDLLKTMGMSDIPCFLGTDRQIGRAWGGYQPRNSPAVEEMVRVVKNLQEGTKLDVLTLGAVTNIASAVILHPEIIPHIRCYALAARYNAETSVWDKDEFNVRNDLNAFNYLLNLEGFDFYIMPITTALPYRFKRDDTFAKLNEKNPVEKALKDRWVETEADSKERVLWDLALAVAYLEPELCKIERRLTPPENKQRYVNVYTQIDRDAMVDDFWKSIKNK